MGTHKIFNVEEELLALNPKSRLRAQYLINQYILKTGPHCKDDVIKEIIEKEKENERN